MCFPLATKDKIYVGKQTQFNGYKHALATAYASHPATQQRLSKVRGRWQDSL